MKIQANSKPQELFLASSAYEVLFGGSAGGGKTQGIILDPLRYINVSDYRAIIFRESFTELEKAVIPTAIRVYGAAGATYNQQKRRFTFPSGAYIDCGYLATENDWNNYQGTEYVGQYFDEFTNIKWNNYEQLAIWNRASTGGILPYRRATANPGGVSHSQVKQYFVDMCPPLKDGEPIFSKLANMTWQPMKAGRIYTYIAENGMKLTRQYIPSRVFNNEDLLRNNPNYLAQLLKLPESKRKAYLEGDWDVFEGQFFDNWKADIHVIPPTYPEQGYNVLGVIDYGERSVLEVGYSDFLGNFVVFAECYTEGMSPVERFTTMAEMLIEKKLYNLTIRYDTNMDIDLKNYTGYDKLLSTMARDTFYETFKARGLAGKEPTLIVVSKSTTDKRGYRAITNEAVRECLDWRMENGEFTKRPRLFITQDCKHLIKELPEFIHDPDSPDGLDFMDTKQDDSYDAMKMLLMGLRESARPQQKEEPKNLDQYMQQKIFNPMFDKLERPKVRI